MKKFTAIKSIPAYLPIVNIDTDMIIPKQFLKTIKRTGLGKNLFFEMRYDEKGNEIDDFIESALVQLSKQEIRGKEVTPFLLKYIAKKTGGRSLEANIALALNNVALGIEVAKKMYEV